MWEMNQFELVKNIVYLGLAILLFRLFITFCSMFLKNLIDSGDSSMVDVSNGTFYPVSYWTEKGGRPYQEDRVACLPGKMEIDSSLYAVYDGHGGAKAAQFCKDKLLKYVVEDICFQEDSSRALTNAFHRTENEFLEIARRFNLMDGSTAVVSLIHNRKVTVANAGDSRCIIVQRHGKVKAMSIDHKPCREDEEKRIRALGGRVVFWGRWRVEGVLAVSRAIGDLSLKPYVSCDPELITKTLDEDDLYMVLASDGLWDVMRNEEVSKFVLSCPDFASMGRDLCHEATLIGSTDNITVLVIDLKKRAVSASVVSSTKN